jgi:hypothetical protein
MNRFLPHTYILVSSCHSNRENTGVPHNFTRHSISLQIHEHQTPTILTVQAKSNGNDLKHSFII